MENFINPFYSMKIFDRHKIHELVKGTDKVTRLHSNGWYKFNASYDITFNVIINFTECVLFEDENDTGTKCVRILFHDNSFVYAAYSFDSFNKWLNDVYLPIYTNWSIHQQNNKNEKTE